MNRHFYCLFLILGLLFSFQESSGKVYPLRMFPELENIKVYDISVVDENNCIAVGENKILKWDGKKWAYFEPSPPIVNLFEINKVNAFTPDNIWIFFKKYGEFHYHSDIMRFDGQNWKSVESPQAFDLINFDFLNPNSFVACGHWGSFVLHNGGQTINLPGPVSSDLYFPDLVSDTSGFVWAGKDNKSSMILFRFTRSRLRKIYDSPNRIIYSNFEAENKGVFITVKGEVFRKTSENIILEKHIKFGELSQIISSDGYLVFFRDSAANYIKYDFRNNESELLDLPKNIEIKFIKQIAPGEYLLIAREGKVLYYGYKNWGIPIPQNDKLFVLQKFSYLQVKNHLGLGVFRNKNGKIEYYFTNPDGNNNFFSPFKQNDPYNFKDIILKRKLYGYTVSSEDSTMFDGATFFLDIDNDHDMDAVILGLRGKTRFYENIGDDTFDDVTKIYGFKLIGRFKHCAIWDLNNDGYLDMILGNELGPLEIFKNCKFWRFKAQKFFQNSTGVLEGYMPAFADVDGDNDLDLFLYSNFDHTRFLRNKGIYNSSGLPVFKNESDLIPDLTSRIDDFPKTLAFADYDNDGDLDLFSANRQSSSRLYENDGFGILWDVTAEKGIHFKHLSYNANWGDLDQDGFQDLFITTLGKNYILWNKGGASFQVDSISLPDNKYGYSTASLLLDADEDGDLDIIIANYYNSYNRIYENMLNKNNFLIVETEGTISNRYGIGAKILAYRSGSIENKRELLGLRVISVNGGYCSSGLPEAHFAFSSDSVVTIKVIFPSGNIIEKKEVRVGQRIKIREPSPALWWFHQNKYNLFSYFLNARSQKMAIKILLFLIIVVIANYLIFRETYWQGEIYLFYNSSIFFAFLLFNYIIPQKTDLPLLLLPIYFSTAFAIILFWVIQKYRGLNVGIDTKIELYQLARQFYHGHMGIAQIDRILFFCNNQKTLLNNSTLISDFYSELRYFYHNTLPILSQLIRLLYQMPNAFREPHLNRRIHWFIRKMIRSGNINSSDLHQLRNQLEKMKIEIGYIRKWVEKEISVGLFHVLTEALNKFPQFNQVSIHRPIDADSIHVVIPHHELVQVFDCLFQNAVEAMVGMKEKELKINIKPVHWQSVKIEVSDLGPGIPKDIQEKIFQEGFSTKQSTGLGLYHSRKILERYGGSLNLANVGPGAVFEMTLRVREHGKT